VSIRTVIVLSARSETTTPWRTFCTPGACSRGGVGSLAAAGKHPREGLFYLYALLPLAVGFMAEQLRVTSAQTVLDQRGIEDAQAVGTLPEPEQREVVALVLRREMGVMAISALVVVFLALRAAGTAHGF